MVNPNHGFAGEPNRRLSHHGMGLLLTTVGVLVLTPDSLMIRAVDVDAPTLLFWRGLLMFLVLTSVTLVRLGKGAAAEFRSIGLPGLVVAALFGSQLILFVTSVSNTSVANTLVIFATAPLFTAVLSWVFLGERVQRRVWIAVIVCLGAVIFIFVGSIGDGRLGGDLAAVGAAIAMAAGLTITRRGRAVSMVPAWGLGGGIAAAAVFAVADPLSVEGSDWLILLGSGLFILPIAFGLIAHGPRRLSAPETGLLMLLETILGPLWVWWFLAEQPNDEALIGGTIVVGVLVANSMLGLRETSRI
jgi:drug/metabolite transporter (DMT)-like permease